MPLKVELRELWKPPDYRADFGSAAVVPPPSSPFLRVYYLTSAEHAVSDIALRRIKVARFTELNDPFELVPINFREKHVRKFIKEAGAVINNLTGLVCFCADWTSPVLWSHYASKHYGICLGFDLRKTLAERVTYESDRLPPQISDGADPNSLEPRLRRLLLCTKYKQWDYEQEVRLIVPLEETSIEGGLHFRPFDEDLQLAEVILGERCTLSLASVRELVRNLYPTVRVFGAGLAFKFFKVVPQPTTVDW